MPQPGFLLHRFTQHPTSLPDSWRLAYVVFAGRLRLIATYQDKSRATRADPNSSQPMPVADLYDFGGGFYFTLLLGREGTSRRMGPDEGWLIGEARLLGNALTGSIAFYPYSQHTFWSAGLASPPQPGQPDNQAMSQPGWREWLPNRVAP